MKYKLEYDKYGQIVIEPAGRGKILYRKDGSGYLYDDPIEAKENGNLFAFSADKYIGRLIRMPGYDLK